MMDHRQWQQLGKYHEIDGHQIFFVHKSQGKTPICILHGYPSCSFDYYACLAALSNDHDLVLHDHLGFGFSDKPKNHNYLLSDQADIAIQLWTKLGYKKIHLVAHDYGTSVATEIIARYNEGILPFKVNSLTLSNGSMLIDMAKLRLIQRLLKSKFFGPIAGKISSKAIFMYNMKKLWGDRSLVNKNDLEELWEMLLLKNGRTVLPTITQYIDQRYQYYDRWIGALKETNIPTHVLWGDQDPVAVVKMADRLLEINPKAKKTILQGVGHYPMMERPKLWSKHLLDFLKEY